jgi:hypothetical protein
VPKVYVLNKGGYDYSAAQRYGELVYCTDGPLNKNDINQSARLMAKALRDSDSSDYIVLTSLSSLCSIACAIFAAQHQRLNLLIYKAGQYYEYTIEIKVRE